MYKITGAKYRKDTREVVGYIVSDGNTNEVLAHNMVYWLVKAGLISNATAKEDGDKLIVETDAIIGSEFTSEDFQIKTEKIYEAIRKLNNEYAFNLNHEECKVKIVGSVYKYHLNHIKETVEKNVLNNLYYNTNIVEDNIEYVGYEVKNTGNHLIYYVTYDLNTGKCGMDILNPGETVVLSVHAIKLLLAQENVTCENGYLCYDIYGPDAEPNVFEIDDDILFRTTYDVTKKTCFNAYADSIIKNLMTKEDIKEQLDAITNHVA